MVETKTSWEFVNSPGPFASCHYRDMESCFSEFGYGTWKIATTAETFRFSRFRNDAFFWTSTRNLWTPEGIIVYDDPERKMPSDAETLMKMHNDGDPTVRYVKRGFKDGKMTIEDFVNNPLVLAQVKTQEVGEEKMKDIVRYIAKSFAVDSEHAYVHNDYFEGKQDKRELPLRHTGIDIWGPRYRMLHLYCSAGEDVDGGVHGYMKRYG